MKINNYDNENDILMFNIFNDYLEKISITKNYSIELYITPFCNKKCEYCYLVKNQKDIYPKEIADEENILNNLKIFFNYLITTKNNYIKELSLFSGEIWHTNFGFEILNTILYFLKEKKISIELITIPSNFTFILDKNIKKKIEYFIKEFYNNNTKLSFSCSTDGLYLEESNRPYNNNNKDNNLNKYYYLIFNFCAKWGFGYHPMVDSNNIELWPKQYEWWINGLLYCHQNYAKDIMFLEVRNDTWTDEKIEKFLFFINHAYNFLYQSDFFHSNIKSFMEYILSINQPENNNYQNLILSKTGIGMNCTIDRSLIIRLGDLAWIPCHRTSYDNFIYGNFKIENNNIIGIKANNIPLLISVYNVGYKGHPKCDICPINALCPRQCYGACYESNKELFYPCETVCNLYIAKTLFLYFKTLNFIKKYNYNNQEINLLLQYYNNNYISKIPKEVKEKWNPIIQKLLMI